MPRSNPRTREAIPSERRVQTAESRVRSSQAVGAALETEVAVEVLDACWSRIGVQGDGSCAELATHVHCRNCPIFIRAGTLLLNRPLPAHYRQEWTLHFAGQKQRAAATDSSATLFRIGREWLGIDTSLVQEIAERRPLHSLPHRRLGIVLGLVNVRGELLLCVSLSRLLHLGQDASGSHRAFSRLIVLNSGRFAFPVDEVHGVHRFSRQELKPPPVTLTHDHSRQGGLTRGLLPWRGHLVGYLDGEALLTDLNRSLS